jgi:hypothetical protein
MHAIAIGHVLSFDYTDTEGRESHRTGEIMGMTPKVIHLHDFNAHNGEGAYRTFTIARMKNMEFSA